jgi:hypothetical protein
LSNEEKTNDYENFEKGMIYMKILKKGGVVEKRGEEETKSMPHAPVNFIHALQIYSRLSQLSRFNYKALCRIKMKHFFKQL